MTDEEKIPSTALLAFYLFDSAALGFLNTDKGDIVLGNFYQLPAVTRIKTARAAEDYWREGRDLPSGLVLLEAGNLPVALPREQIIVVDGFYERHPDSQIDAIALDEDGFPTDPARAMELLENLLDKENHGDQIQ